MNNRVKFPKVFEDLFKPARYKVFYGGRGGGRSWSFARALLIEAGRKTLRILCAREYQKSIRDSVHRLLADQIELMQLGSLFDIQKTEIRSVSGSLFLFEGIAQNVTKIKSIEGIDICWVEEAEKVSENSWDVLIPTIRKDGSEIWVSFNPDLETDPTYQRFVLSRPPNSIIKKTSWRDNHWFPEELKKEKDYLWKVDPERAAHVWDGECRSHSDAQVLKGKWIIDAFEPKQTWSGPYFGADWGFAADPTTLVKFWLDEDTNLYLEHEAYGVGVDLDDTPAMFDRISDSRKYVIRADCARPETISHMRRRGFNIVGAPKWTGSVEDGIAWLRGRPKIIIHDRCRHAAEEARNWSYKTDRLTGDVLPVLQDGFDHIWDAIRYGAYPMIKKRTPMIGRAV